MKKNILLVFGIVCMAAFAYGQNTSITNNNTVTINGDVYYFRPSTTPSSPQPRVGSSDFISYGRWYGADAARAWASIVDWTIEHCETVQGYNPSRASSGTMVYISSVEARKEDYVDYNHVIRVYYWIVPRGARMEEGSRETRTFFFR
ncbi:MAG: hypothetical protein LBK62_00870 [Treponema sp.]|jgi:hypothetical protein|nr:hypothetical protein [Treponema sp.]